MFLDVFTDRQWLTVASILYVAAFALGLTVWRKNRRPTRLMYLFVAVGFLTQTVGLHLRGIAAHGCPLGNKFEIIQFTVWSCTLLYLVVGPAFRMSVIGYFCAALTSSLSTISLAISSWDAPVRQRLMGHNPWIELHAALAVFSYGVFALLALVAVMYLLQLKALRGKNVRGWSPILPSIVELDNMGTRLLIFGAAILTISLGVGSVHWAQNFDSVPLEKLFVTLAVWLAYVVLLVLRVRERLTSARFAWVCIILFSISFLSLWPVNASRRETPPTLPSAPQQP